MDGFYLGNDCYVLRFGQTIDKAINERVLSTYHLLKQDSRLCNIGVRDVVPTYCTIGVYFDPSLINLDKLQGYLSELTTLASHSHSIDKKQYLLDVIYDGADLNRVAEHCGLCVQEVIKRHLGADYTVAMVGFVPHFPYLLGLDPRLVTPRLNTPRVRVPAGSVAIGGEQTGVYPTSVPGGWNLIGHIENVELLKILKPGDGIRFIDKEGCYEN